MNKATTAKALSAAAIANLAMVGFVASPAGASTHSTTGATEAAVAATWVPSAGKARSGLMHKEKASPQVLQAMAPAKSAAKTRGFVPLTSSGLTPDTASGCNQHVCIGVAGTGLNVTSENQHFWGKSGCHVADFSVKTNAGQVLSSGHTTNCYYSKQGAHAPVSGTWSQSVYICAGFWNVVGEACVHVVR